MQRVTFPGERSVYFIGLWPLGRSLVLSKVAFVTSWLESTSSLSVDLVALDKSFILFLLPFLAQNIEF